MKNKTEESLMGLRDKSKQVGKSSATSLVGSRTSSHGMRKQQVGKPAGTGNDKQKETCEVKYVHKGRVDSARKAIHDDDTIAELTETFNVLGDPTRLRIVLALSKEELCVCDIAALLSMTESAISHQLRLLKNLRLVKFMRKGKMMYYSLDDEHIEDLLRFAVRHVSEG